MQLTHKAGLGLALLTMGGLAALPAHAGVTSYDTLAAFQAASTTTVQATFEGPTVDTKYFGPITEGNVTFAPGPSQSNIAIGTPHGSGSNYFGEPVTSNYLSASGNEDINMTFSVPTTAVGWDSYTSNAADPTVTVYDTSKVLIGTFKLTQAPDTKGFFGVTSTAPIGRINWLAAGGPQNTAIDNVRTGSAPVPEVSTLVSTGLLLCLGVGGLAVSMRRRKAQAGE